MIESQAGYIVQAIEQSHGKALQVSASVEENYNHELQHRLSQTAFADVGESWYLDGGRITNNWAGGTREYMRRLRRFDPSVYQSV